MVEQRTRVGRLSIDNGFLGFVAQELLPAAGIDAGRFWTGVESIVAALTPRNHELLRTREELQHKIDAFHSEHRNSGYDHAKYVEFLRAIGYLVDPVDEFSIATNNVDAEIADIAGPQLVVPVNNARFALNAANARWGSLYDALYGTDVIDSSDGREPGDSYNPKRGAAVIDYAARFLDRAIPLAEGSHLDVAEYVFSNDLGAQLEMRMQSGKTVTLKDISQFRGHAESGARLLFRNNGLHLELLIDSEHPIGRSANGHLADVILESAITTIQDCEDSVAAVDANDKTAVYRNWLGLMQGTLHAQVSKNGKTQTRSLNKDREYTGYDGCPVTLPGRSLMLVRNVGHLMQTDAIFDSNGEEVFEGILDAIFTVACALNDIRGQGTYPNSRTGSVYIVKPKMHGPEEAAFSNDLMSMVEDLYDIPRYSIKIGVMDEERRTTANLAQSIRAVRQRLVFINTGFLDRTGDEIHTCMQAGPVLRKETIKTQAWIVAYEDRNVDIGIRCGLPGRAQIGKGMWPKTDAIKEMVETKVGHPMAGASCAWVPSPTGATLHAMHYHDVDVAERQSVLSRRDLASIDDILTPPLARDGELSPGDIQSELDNNAQGILGYVVRWIDQGIGCSKVPDINGVNLMEDRATLRISSQHIANWLLHGVCNEAQVRETLLRMAAVVDEQNAHDDNYTRMSDAPDRSIAFQAACDLVFKGAEQPSGYTEPLLHARRRERKSQLGLR